MRKILIVGGGNLGYFLSQALMEDGYSVSLIEKEKEYCRRVANLLDIPVICGDGTMVETLARGGAGDQIHSLQKAPRRKALAGRRCPFCPIGAADKKALGVRSGGRPVLF